MRDLPEAFRNLKPEDRALPSPTMGLFYISLFLLVRSVYFHNGSSARKSAKFPSRRHFPFGDGVHKKDTLAERRGDSGLVD